MVLQRQTWRLLQGLLLREMLIDLFQAVVDLWMEPRVKLSTQLAGQNAVRFDYIPYVARNDMLHFVWREVLKESQDLREAVESNFPSAARVLLVGIVERHSPKICAPQGSAHRMLHEPSC